MKTVWVGTITHKHGPNLYAAKTEYGLYRVMVEQYIKERWGVDGPADTPMPEDALSAIQLYFNSRDETHEEGYEIQRIEVAP